MRSAIPTDVQTLLRGDPAVVEQERVHVEQLRLDRGDAEERGDAYGKRPSRPRNVNDLARPSIVTLVRV